MHHVEICEEADFEFFFGTLEGKKLPCSATYRCKFCGAALRVELDDEEEQSKIQVSQV